MFVIVYEFGIQCETMLIVVIAAAVIVDDDDDDVCRARCRSK